MLVAIEVPAFTNQKDDVTFPPHLFDDYGPETERITVCPNYNNSVLAILSSSLINHGLSWVMLKYRCIK